jgi:hypothetical protein
VKKFFLSLLSAILLSACQQGGEKIDMNQVTPEERDAVESLMWVKQADAAKDAQDSLDRGDTRLLAMATRGSYIPGIDPERVTKAKNVCGVRYVSGSTDTVLGDTHMKLLQAAEAYATAFNKIMINHCLSE